jgi:hypothetical protein
LRGLYFILKLKQSDDSNFLVFLILVFVSSLRFTLDKNFISNIGILRVLLSLSYDERIVCSVQLGKLIILCLAV